MALADSLKQEIHSAPRTSVCSVVKIIDRLSKEDKDILQKALYDRGIKASVLGRALAKEKIEISVSTITRHRNGGCATCAAK
jgi:hypothetical protein